jgi:hypothetical protein
MLSSMPIRRSVFALLAMFAMLACQPKPTDIPGPERPWKSMSHEDRQIYMAQTVLPHMQETFQAFDAERFAGFDCSTCHPSGAARGDFAMPDAGIPKLSRWKFRTEHWKKHPETVRFMWEKVDPEMSALLGGPKGLRGFNCRDCHMTR